MVDRIKATVDARRDPAFGIMARTDALAVEGLERALDRAAAYVEAGADYLFPEALTGPQMYAEFSKIGVPVLANMTEFGQSPLHTTETLEHHGVDMVLYPLSAFRAMSAVALRVYTAIRQDGTQSGMLDQMQTRAELYEILNYHAYEQKLDELFAKEKIDE
jgi:methylisocitrate lyase